MPEISANQEGSVALASAAPASVKAVLYAVYGLGDDNQLQLVEQKIVSVAGQNSTFPTTMQFPTGAYVVFAYGIENNGNASIISYEDYVATIGDDVASLSYVRSVVVKGGTLTKTACATSPAN